MQTKLTQFIAEERSSELWQGKVNLNQELKLALISEQANNELKELIESIISNSLVSPDTGDIVWEIGEKQTRENNEHQNTIFSQIEPESDDWQILLAGLAQLYILGVTIDWEPWAKNIAGRKISLPTYPFQRQTYWLD